MIYCILWFDFEHASRAHNIILCTFLLFFLGINIFLDGFVPTENLRFRETSLTFKVAETADKVVMYYLFLHILRLLRTLQLIVVFNF